MLGISKEDECIITTVGTIKGTMQEQFKYALEGHGQELGRVHLAYKVEPEVVLANQCLS